jgi:flavorubredoxin
MKRRAITDSVDLLGAIDWDRRLFDALIPLPHGTSYNAYLVRGADKTALLDTVDPQMWPVLEEQLRDVAVVDYVIHHHGEQDHSGSLPFVLGRYPDAVVVTNEKCKAELIDHLHVTEDRFRVVADGETLSLGGATLTFVATPWVHWPETFCTWLEEQKILFSCDLFGSHLATSDVFAGQSVFLGPAKRYYAEIMMPFAGQVMKNVEKVSSYPIGIIAPSHGPLHDKPALIMDAYREWAGGEPRNVVCLPYISMHDSTRLMVDRLTAALVERGVAVERHELSGVDLGELAMSLVDAATIVIGTSTVLTGPHPTAAAAAYLAGVLKPKARFATVIGSYGWAGKTVDKLVALMPGLKAELLDPVIVKGLPRDEDYAALDALAATIAEKHRGLAPR